MTHTTISLGLVLATLQMGCGHRVHVTSTPPGAVIRVDDEPVGYTPGDVQLRWWVFKHPDAELRLVGYRPVDLELQRRLLWRWTKDLVTLRFGRLSGTKARSEVQGILMPVHDPAGTWGPDDALTQ